MASIDIRLKRASKEYAEGEVVSGDVTISGPSNQSIQHNGIILTLDGVVNINQSQKSVGVFEAFANSAKPIQLINVVLELSKAGKFSTNKVVIPFEIPLKSKGKPLYETYHGVFINIQYLIRVDMKRSFLNKDLSKSTEIMIIYGPNNELAEKATISKVDFTITPEKVLNAKDPSKIPSFKIDGFFESNICSLVQSVLNGELIVRECKSKIKSIELQLIRVETCGCAEGYSRDSTEIQNIQIADGDVCHNLRVPIYMVFPRLFTCPSVVAANFKIEFEINLVIVFQDDKLISETFPLKLTRF